MSQRDSPIRTMFDAQRTATRQTEQAFKQGMQTQEAAGRLLLTGLRLQQTIGRQSLEVAHAATRGYVETVETMAGATGATDGRRTVEETFQRLKETHQQFYETVDAQLRQGVDSYDDLSAEYFETLDETTDQLLETADTIEDQTAEGFDEFNQQVREQFERTQELQDDLEDQFEEGAEQTRELLERQADQAEQFQEEIERQGEQMRQQVEEGAERAQQMAPVQQGQSPPEGQPAPEDDLEDIEGIGPATKEDLQAGGVETLGDLAQADPAMVAEVTGVSADRAAEWVDEAGQRVGTPA